MAGLLTAAAAIIGALAGLFAQMRATHALVNSRMSELLDLTRRASLAQGRLAQREGNGESALGAETVQNSLLQGESGGPLADDSPAPGA